MIVEEICLHCTGCIRGHTYKRSIQPRQHVLESPNSRCSCQKAYLPLWLLKGPLVEACKVTLEQTFWTYLDHISDGV